MPRTLTISIDLFYELQPSSLFVDKSATMWVRYERGQ